MWGQGATGGSSSGPGAPSSCAAPSGVPLLVGVARSLGGTVGRAGSLGRRLGAGQDRGQGLVVEPLELALLAAGPVQHGHLEVARRDVAVTGLAVAQRRGCQLECVVAAQSLRVALLEVLRDRLGRATHHGDVVLLDDLAVEGEPKDLVVLGRVPHLRDEDLDLVGLLGARGEDRAQGLGIGVGQAASGHVEPVVGVAAHVGEAHAGDPEVLELVVAPDRGEGDPVVDLADLVQRRGGVLGDEQHAVGVPDHRDRTSPPDALAREVGPVLHHLLGRDVERHAHERPPAAHEHAGALCLMVRSLRSLTGHARPRFRRSACPA